jgi:lipopolysaccharide export system permease protein
MVTDAWLRDGNRLIHAGHIGYTGGIHLERVTIYDRKDGALSQISDVERASPLPDGAWKLEGVTSYDVGGHVVRKIAEMRGLEGIEPDRFTLAKVDPTEKDFLTLRRDIDALRLAGRPAEEAETGWWHKLSGPLSTVLMPLLAAMAAFGLARSGKTLLRATMGMALGFAYFVVDNVSVALGNVGAYPPILAAWAPFLLFLLIGETVLVRSEE